MQGSSYRNGRRVVVTGTGLITSVGHSVEDAWNAILDGQSGIGEFTIIEKGDLSSTAVCEVKDFDPTVYLSKRDTRRRDNAGKIGTHKDGPRISPHKSILDRDDHAEWCSRLIIYRLRHSRSIKYHRYGLRLWQRCRWTCLQSNPIRRARCGAYWRIRVDNYRRFCSRIRKNRSDIIKID